MSDDKNRSNSSGQKSDRGIKPVGGIEPLSNTGPKPAPTVIPMPPLKTPKK